MVDFTVDTENGAVSGTAKKIVDGVESILDLDTEVSTAELLFTKPDGTELALVSMTLTNPGSGDGKFNYKTSGAFFSAEGTWKVKAKYTLTTGEILWSNPPKEFQVDPE